MPPVVPPVVPPELVPPVLVPAALVDPVELEEDDALEAPEVPPIELPEPVVPGDDAHAARRKNAAARRLVRISDTRLSEANDRLTERSTHAPSGIVKGDGLAAFQKDAVILK
jgi:hypothetical protein